MVETRRLYYEDVYIKIFPAQVKECRKGEKGYEILLDQSAFYPEGGGQPCDLGVLGDVPVKDVQEKDGELIHYTEKPFEPGTELMGEIDWARRFDLMQQHSGEHIVSGLVHEKYGYDNVGFHMSSDVITIDFSGVLDKKQLEEIEAETNRKIWENSPVEIFYPEKEELDQLPYRSKKELTGKVRLVRFPGADLCACCGTHVTHTGEIGMVKILTVENFHEGVRVTMISGKRVLEYLNSIHEQNRQVSVKLSAKIGETAQAVERLQEENYRLKGQLLHLTQQLCETEAARYEGTGSVLLFHEGLDGDSVRKMADAVMEKCAGCCAVFSKNPDGSYKYAIGEKNGDLRQFTKEMNMALNGRGGGRPFFVQGSVKADEEQIRRFFER
ncbi:MAG: alanine--tRNA ligase-related protein [Blautia sp.]|uniref:alanyl-tRNA editing protein n=1 Tax=Blautia sp. TaxID=1955243 RepID=UPI002A74CC6A|nr:alanine--tRNA ligase-related protein [Blautia sp.]MDY3016930.1 alanine--tRNA ligase-related protein [Blautia sp.]